MPSDARIAFITDALPSLGGAEKVLFTALELFPSADIFTLVYNRQLFTGTPLADREIRTSPLDRLPLAHTHHRALFPLMPAAVASFNLSDYDIVVSFNYAVAHGVRVPAGARHVSYTYTPMRYAWNNLNIRGEQAPENPLVRLLFSLFRNWDRRAARRVHEFAAISQSIAGRIQRAYGRHAQIIHPPVDVNRFLPGDQRGGDYFVSLSRLVPHKRLDILIAAFNELRLPLLIIGEGPELPRLQQMASANICFAGYLPDPEVGRLLQNARAFVAAGEEDFGIAIVEAQAAGCPVIAYGRGGALETIIEGQTGLFFTEQTTSSLTEAVQEFERSCHHFESSRMVENARRFARPLFLQKFAEFVVGSAGQ